MKKAFGIRKGFVIRNGSGIRKAFLETTMLSCVVLAGCAGPSTRILPRETEPAVLMPETRVEMDRVNVFYLREELEFLSEAPRVSGTKREEEVVSYIGQLLRDYGYDTSFQDFAVAGYEEGTVLSGINVAAVREGTVPDGDILIIGASHDTVPGSPGANDNGSGIVVMLETARLLADLPTDTELRFVSFGGYRDGLAGVHDYVASLTEEERRRVIGAIQLEALGYMGEEEIVLRTVDGGDTLASALLGETAYRELGEQWECQRKDGGGHGVFVRNRIPAASLGQPSSAYENGSPLDRMGIVDIDRVAQVVDVLTRTISGIMSAETPPMVIKSRFYNDLRDSAYVQPEGGVLPFGQARKQVEYDLAIRGGKMWENTSSDGSQIDVYRYLVKWFGVDQIIYTDYYYLDGKLDEIRLDADGAGIEFEDMKERIAGCHGEPAGEMESPAGTGFRWEDTVSGQMLELMPGTDGFEVSIKALGRQMEVLSRRHIHDTEEFIQARTQEENQLNRRMEQVMELVDAIVPPEEGRIAWVEFYTDGAGNTTSYLKTLEAEEAGGETAGFVLGIDLDDAVTADGKWKDRTMLVRELAARYGQVLGLAGQDSYGAAFAERFQFDSSSGSHETAGDAEETWQLPDFAESFMWFVLADRPQEEGEFDRRIRFFYELDGMPEYREQVRGRLQDIP